MPKVFVRVEGEEEVTPPSCSRVRSFDSVAVAQILQSGLPSAGMSDISNEPSAVAQSQAARTGVHEMMDDAAGCLLALSSKEAKKRVLPQPATRRRLQMRTASEATSTLASSEAVTERAQSVPISNGKDDSVKPRSGASVEQLKLLAAAYKLCPQPTPEQMRAIAQRVRLTPDNLERWFESRRVLQGWIQTQPDVRVSDIQGMFYTGEAAIQQATPV